MFPFVTSVTHTAVLILLWILFPTCVSSVRVGRIEYASIELNTSHLPTSSPTCADCLCNCLNTSRTPVCHGINCFPANRSCQPITQPWIADADLSIDSASDRFLTTVDLKFCSCYSSQNLLNTYVTPTIVALPSPSYVRSIVHHVFDDTLIVLTGVSINQYFRSNLTLFRTYATINTPLNALIDDKHIYISFYVNSSVNKYDLNLKFLRTVQKPIRIGSLGFLYGLSKWGCRLLVSDEQLNYIWSMNTSTMAMTIYLNLSTYNIDVFNIAVYQNRLYMSQFASPTIVIVDLLTLSRTAVSFPGSPALYRMYMDPWCQRLWFGVNNQNYSSVPVLDLNTNRAQVYEAHGLLAQTEVHLVAFDSDTSMYAVRTFSGSFAKYPMSSLACDAR